MPAPAYSFMVPVSLLSGVEAHLPLLRQSFVNSASSDHIITVSSPCLTAPTEIATVAAGLSMIVIADEEAIVDSGSLDSRHVPLELLWTAWKKLLRGDTLITLPRGIGQTAASCMILGCWAHESETARQKPDSYYINLMRAVLECSVVNVKIFV